MATRKFIKRHYPHYETPPCEPLSSLVDLDIERAVYSLASRENRDVQDWYVMHDNDGSTQLVVRGAESTITYMRIGP